MQKVPDAHATAKWLTRRQELANIYMAAMGGFPDRCELAPAIVCEVNSDEFTAQWVRYSSESGERVPGLFVRPRNASGRLPVVIAIPGGHRTKDFTIFGHEQWPLPFEVESAHHRIPVERTGNFEPLPYALFLRHGFAVWSTDARSFGARAGPRPADRMKDLSSEFNKACWAEMNLLMRRATIDGRSVAGMETLDIIRGIDYLESRGDVDTSRIACTGWSMGGNLTWMTAIIEPRIKAVCTVSCMITYEAAIKYVRDAAPYAWIPGIRKYTSRQELLSMMAPRPMMCFEGRSDFPEEGYEPMLEEAREKYALLGAEERLSVNFYDGGHAACLREAATYDVMAEWFHRWLG